MKSLSQIYPALLCSRVVVRRSDSAISDPESQGADAEKKVWITALSHTTLIKCATVGALRMPWRSCCQNVVRR